MRSCVLVLLGATCVFAAPRRKAKVPAVVEKDEGGGVVHLALEEDPAAQAWLFKPPREGEEKTKVDLIVALHGAGGNPRNFFLRTLMERRHAWCLAVAGHRRVKTGRGEGFMWEGRDVGYIAGLVRYMLSRYPIAAKRVLIWGHSAGGSMTLAALRHAPELFAGGLTTASPRTPTTAHKEQRICVFLGTRDPNWAGARTVQAYVEKLVKKHRKGACAFFAVEELGHEVPDSAYLELGFDWILHGKARGGEATVGRTPRGGDGEWRHILVRFKGCEGAEGVKRSRAAAEKALKRIRKALDKGRAFFPLEAACHSEDAESASGGGGVGEDRLREMLGKLPDLEPGELSGLLRSRFGVHLVYRERDRGAGRGK